MIDRAPKVVLDAIDLHKDLIQVPLPLSMLSHVRCALRSDLTSEDRTKPVDPSPDALMANIDAALMKEVFDITQ